MSDSRTGRISGLAERMRVSLFFVPTAFVVAAVALGLLAVELDDRVDITGDIPFTGVAGTVDSARAVLSTIAGATITFAGIAFSVSLLTIQLASSQYSPRIVHGIFRDSFNKRAIGVVIGTFTFCLVVLRAVRAPGDGGDPVVPNLSVALAVIFGIGSILTLIAFINHNAHSVDVSELLTAATTQGIGALQSNWSRTVGESDGAGEPPPTVQLRADSALEVRFEESGWIQQVSVERLADAAESDGVVWLAIDVGRYAVVGAPLCTVWPRPDDDERAARVARSAIRLGPTRSLTQDPSYAVRQLADVAIRALSPGVNDPTTAQDAIFHLGSMVHEFLSRQPPARTRQCDDGRIVVFGESADHASIVELAFAEIRRVAAPHPTVCTYLYEVLRIVLDSLEPAARVTAAPLLEEQARRLMTAATHELDNPDDLAQVRRELAERFPAVAVQA